MNLSITQRFYLIAGLAGALTLAAIGFLTFTVLPQLASVRDSIDSRRASIIVAQDRRNNLQALANETKDLADQQKKIDDEMWAFTKEDSFFQVWPSIAHLRGVTIIDPVVSDATPGPDPVSRTIKLVITGPLNQVLQAINDVQAVQPLVAISSVAISPATLVGQATATLQATSLWQ